MSKKLNFGPMDEKCFISRSEVLQWINHLLEVPLTKVEQLGSGNLYCQIFDVIYPGKIPLNKLKWKAKHEYEFTHNFKLLQKGFDSVQVAKAIPIEKLVKAKYQDNLEFAQWMKRFFELNCKDKGKGYDAKKRRNFVDPDLSFAGGGVLPQYTMIYGNFKDMEREIINQDQNDQQEEGGSPSNEDKENVNSINQPDPVKNMKLNSGEKKKTSVSRFENVLTNSNNSNKGNLNSNNVLSIIERTSTQKNLSNCPFFMNNNIAEKSSLNKMSVLGQSQNSSLMRQLENNENTTPSDKILKQKEHLLSSADSQQSFGSFKSAHSSQIEQISKVISAQRFDVSSDKQLLLQMLMSIKNIIDV